MSSSSLNMCPIYRSLLLLRVVHKVGLVPLILHSNSSLFEGLYPSFFSLPKYSVITSVQNNSQSKSFNHMFSKVQISIVGQKQYLLTTKEDFG